MQEDKKTVLIVDDDNMLLTRIASSLSSAGYTTLTAHDGQEGLDTALQSHPDLVLTDFQMPSLTGVEMAERIRRDGWGTNVPIVMMTNTYDLEAVNKMMMINVKDYVIKSDMSLDAINDLVGSYLNTQA